MNAQLPVLAIRPDRTRVELPSIEVLRYGERFRFLPDGSGLVYMQGLQPSQDFWLLDLESMATRRLTQLDASATMRTFDPSLDGSEIVYDRLRDRSDIVLIDLAAERGGELGGTRLERWAGGPAARKGFGR